MCACHVYFTINLLRYLLYCRSLFTTYTSTRPQDGTVSVIVLFTIVSSCVIDCNFYYCKVPHVTDLFVKCRLKTLNSTLTLHYIINSVYKSGRWRWLQNYRFLDLLNVLCVCNGVAIPNNQTYIAEHWLRRDSVRIHTSHLPVSMSLCK